MTETYLYVRVPGCPIAPSGDGLMPLHRLVLFAKIGPGPHPCFRCGEPVDWSDQRTAPGCLIVNHMDRDSRNNAWITLEPSCQGFNVAHGYDLHFDGVPFMVVNGKRIRAIELTCQRASCGKPFLYRLANYEYAQRQGKQVGQFCSKECWYARNH